jgi:NAD(P)H-hydrate epimerase
LKDHHTQVITPEGDVFYNITGNSGLAKGGSGDILTGIITSFLAQHYSEKEAAILGVWFHGRAAEFASEKHSKESVLPTNIIDEFGTVFKELNAKVERAL